MSSIIVLFILLIPGYIGLIIFEFIKGIKAKSQLSQNIFSIFLGLIALLELSLFPNMITYLNDNFIGLISPENALTDPKIISILLFLTFLSIVTSFLISGLVNLTNPILKKIMRRSFEQNLLFSLLQKYTWGTKENEPVHVLLKLKSGNYIYGTYKRASDEMDEPYIYLLGAVELINNTVHKRYFNTCKDRAEDGILINLKDCDFVGFNFTDECLDTFINRENIQKDV